MSKKNCQKSKKNNFSNEEKNIFKELLEDTPSPIPLCEQNNFVHDEDDNGSLDINVISSKNIDDEIKDLCVEVYSDKEEENIMLEKAKQFKDEELKLSLATGQYFENANYKVEMRMKYHVVRNGEKFVYDGVDFVEKKDDDDFKEKYYKLLETIDDKKHKRKILDYKNYQLLYYQKIEKEIELETKVEDLTKELEDARKEIFTVKKRKREIENKIKQVIDDNKKEIDKQKKENFIKNYCMCPICFSYKEKKEMYFFDGCKVHSTCSLCASQIVDRKCPICKMDYFTYNKMFWGSDLDSEDYEKFKEQQN